MLNIKQFVIMEREKSMEKYYCEKCRILSDDTHCYRCGGTNLKKVNKDDFFLLTKVEESFGKMIIESLKNIGVDGVVLPVGNGVRSLFALKLGYYEIYVRYKDYNKASEIVDFFTENYSTESLREKLLKNIDKWHFNSEKVEKKIRKKLKLSHDVDLIQIVKEKVEMAHTISDVGLLTSSEHGIVVKTDKIILWFYVESFDIII